MMIEIIIIIINLTNHIQFNKCLIKFLMNIIKIELLIPIIPLISNSIIQILIMIDQAIMKDIDDILKFYILYFIYLNQI